MKAEMLKRDGFYAIGKEGGTADGPDFVKRLWEDAFLHLNEIKEYLELDETGNPKESFGLMSSYQRDFSPWEENFTKGLYLASFVLKKKIPAPEGWKVVEVPPLEYYAMRLEPGDEYGKCFNDAVAYYLPLERLEMAKAAFDHHDFRSGADEIYFPVKAKKYRRNPNCPNRIAPCGLHCGACFFDRCGGCLSHNDFCSLAAFSKDHVCPNVACLKEKSLERCADCRGLADCKVGIFANSRVAKASSIFLSSHSLEELGESLDNGALQGLNYSKSYEGKSIDEVFSMLEKNLAIKK